jgi:hypothetical protein
MSFAKDLWDELDLLDKHSLTQRKSAEEFLQLLRERALHEVFYERGLERIALHRDMTPTTETLSPAIAAMKRACEKPGSQRKEDQLIRRQLQALLTEHSDVYQCFQEWLLVGWSVCS